jgi:Cu(I)/Ag(I) efflux system membrane fusion protein
MTTNLRMTMALFAAAMAGAAGGIWYAHSAIMPVAAAQTTAKTERSVLYYRDPSGAPLWSATPKKDTEGRDYLPVYDDEEISFEDKPADASASAGQRKILYYRNPMGLPDTSPTKSRRSSYFTVPMPRTGRTIVRASTFSVRTPERCTLSRLTFTVAPSSSPS